MFKSLLKASVLVASASALLVAGGLAAAPTAASAASLRPIGSTATFKHFSITVQDAVMDPEYYGYAVKLKVCVRSLPAGSKGGRTRISWDPWTVTAGGRSYRPSVQEDPPADTFPRPYATEGRFRVGECATGWLPFWSAAGRQVTSINYGNSLGNRARWQSGPWHLGSTATFTHFTVRVSAVQQTRYWVGVRATTCVRSVPHGRRTVRISWDPWSLTTSHGNVPLAITQEGTSPWRRIYPEETRLAKGQCVTGWLPFARTRGQVRSVHYANSLGNQVTWRI